MIPTKKSAVLWLTALVSAIGAIAMANPDGSYPVAIASALTSVTSAVALARLVATSSLSKA